MSKYIKLLNSMKFIYNSNFDKNILINEMTNLINKSSADDCFRLYIELTSLGFFPVIAYDVNEVNKNDS